MIGKKIQNIQFLSLQSRSVVHQLSNIRQPHWLEQRLSVPWPWGTHSSSPAHSGLKSGRRDHCNAKQSGDGRGKAPLSGRAQVAARSILSPAQTDGNHPNLFPALQLQSSTTELGKPAVPCSAWEKQVALCWLLCTLGHDLASSGLATETANGKGEKNALKQSNQVRGIRTGGFRLFSSAIIPFAAGQVLLPPPLTPSSAPLSV